MPAIREALNPDHYKNAMNLPRVNLAPFVEFLHEYGCRRFRPDLLAPRRGPFGLFGRKHFSPTPEEAVAIYHKGKSERYGLTTTIAARVIERALDARLSRPPYGLIGSAVNMQTWESIPGAPVEVIKWLGPNDPFRFLDRYMMQTINTAYYDEMDDLEEYSRSYPKEKISRNFNRLKQWEEFYYQFLPLTELGDVHLGEDVKYTFGPVFTDEATGTGTAVRFAPSLLRVIPQVAQRDIPYTEINPVLLGDIAGNSFHLPTKAAMLPFDVFPVLHDVLSNEVYQKDYIKSGVDETKKYSRGIFDPVHFKIHKNRNGYRMDYADHVWELVEYFMSFSESSGQEITAGCPAMGRPGGDKSSVQKFWEWNVDIARKVYRDYWPIFEPVEAKQARYDWIKNEAEARGMVVAGIHF